MGDPRPIGFFDSGVGGLTVLVEVMRRLPREDTIYLGDNARTPYGPRPDDEVVRFSTECLDALAERDVKAIVVACNTSTAIALPILRRRYALPILGVVRPGATAAALATRTRAVGVIATQATVRSHAYFEAIKEEDPFVEVYEHATPELVPLVEAGRLSGPDVEVVLRRSLAPLLGSQAVGDGARDESFVFPMPRDARIDTLLLGCTHYPLLGPVIRGLVGDDIAVIDSASATASALASLIEVHGLGAPDRPQGRHLMLTTGDVAAFRRTALLLFGEAFGTVETLTSTGRCRGRRPASDAPLHRRMTVAGGADRLRASRPLRIGLAIGIGLAARAVAGRATVRPAEGLVDWERAQRIAHRRLVRAPGRLSEQQLRATRSAYARHMARVVPLLESRWAQRCPASSSATPWPAAPSGRRPTWAPSRPSSRTSSPA